MDVDQLTAAGRKLFGHKHWKLKLAQALGVNPATIYRMVKRLKAAAGTREGLVPGPYEVAIKGMLQHKRAQDVLDKAARKLLPRKFRYKRKTDGQGRPVKRLIKRRARGSKVSENETPFEEKTDGAHTESAHTESTESSRCG